MEGHTGRSNIGREASGHNRPADAALDSFAARVREPPFPAFAFLFVGARTRDVEVLAPPLTELGLRFHYRGGINLPGSVFFFLLMNGIMLIGCPGGKWPLIVIEKTRSIIIVIIVVVVNSLPE